MSDKPQLQMIWPEEKLNSPPELHLSEGYTLRTYQEEDESAYLELMHQAGFTYFSAENVQKILKTALPDGFFVIEYEANGVLVATAVATHNPGNHHPFGGELGWVGAANDHAGQGLGYSVCAAVVQRYLNAGYKRIYLQTDDFRLPAIKVYLKLGFVPFIFAPNMWRRWQEICKKLEWPYQPDNWSCTPESMEPEESEEEVRQDRDTMERYRKRFRWHPNREHRGHSTPGDIDAMGDESLYKPSMLGSASVSPSVLLQGTTRALQFTFTAGPQGLPEGTDVSFVIRGQKPLGSRPGEPMTVNGPDSCEIDGHVNGFVLRRGSLSEGQTVTCNTAPFEWTPIAGTRECKVVITYPDAQQPQRRLPEPLRITICPGQASCQEALLPCTYRPGDRISAHITTRDAQDNRVPVNDHLTISGQNLQRSTTAVMTNGLTQTAIRPSDTGIVQVKTNTRHAGLSCLSNPSIPMADWQLYVGDLHCHDFLSEAEGYPDAVYRWAIEDRKLDFVSVVPQSHGFHDNETWTLTKYMNERFLEEGRFVPLLGFEWQHTGYGDKVVHYLGGDQPYLPVDDTRYNSAKKLYEALRNSDAFVISHHPAYPPGSWCGSTDFDCVETDVERVVEIWSMHGSSEGYDPNEIPVPKADSSRTVMNALRKGLRLGFVAGSDTHSARPGGSAKEPRSNWGGLAGVWAPALTRRDIFNALRQRHTYALTGARIVLKMTVNGALMGSELPASKKAQIRIDTWAPGQIQKITVVKNTNCLQEFQPQKEEAHLELEDETHGQAFYHCRVTLADGNLAVCSPVWVG